MLKKLLKMFSDGIYGLFMSYVFVKLGVNQVYIFISGNTVLYLILNISYMILYLYCTGNVS